MITPQECDLVHNCIRLICGDCRDGVEIERQGMVFRHPTHSAHRRADDWKLCPALGLHCLLAKETGQAWAAGMAIDFKEGSIQFR